MSKCLCRHTPTKRPPTHWLFFWALHPSSTNKSSLPSLITITLSCLLPLSFTTFPPTSRLLTGHQQLSLQSVCLLLSLHPKEHLPVCVCQAEVWTGNQRIQLETHRTRGSQPHKSPLQQPRASRAENTLTVRLHFWILALSVWKILMCLL